MGKLGYSTYTLTDLTETLPISLVLETNQEQNIQTKEGEFYTPNFETGIEGEELIITPSLFLGSIEREVPTDYPNGSYIYYETGEMEKLEDGSIHEKQYYYDKDKNIKQELIYVDNEGRLHYKKNLTENLTIEAYIKGFKNKVDQDYITSELVRAQNPITILLLEQGKGIYTLVISSSGNREHFEENNKTDITLTATLYKGAESILDGVEYEWDIVTDTDTEKEDDDYSDENNKNDKTDFISYEQEITIQRADVDNIQVYQCTATFNGLEFSSQKIIRDFTDGYTNQLIANNSLILTPNNLTVTLTNQVWYQTGIINGDDITDQEKARFNYEWILLKSDNKTEIALSGEENKKLEINLNNSIYPRENFSILGKVTIDNKTITVNYADIKYQPVAYSVNVSPKTIFVPATKDGDYRGTENIFTQTIKFQLLDENKSPLLYNSLDSTEPNLQQKEGDKDLSEFDEQINKEEGLWSFEIPFKLDTTKNNNLWDTDTNSKTYEFTYGYLGNTFTEEFEVVKNYAGANGENGAQGFSGYTVDLSNSFHAFPGGEDHAIPGQKTNFEINAYYGDKLIPIKEIYLSDQRYLFDGKESFTQNINNIKIEASVINTNKIKIDLTTGEAPNFTTKVEPILFYIVVTNEEGKDFTFIKNFSYIINYNKKSYSLYFPEGNVIKYSELKRTYTPSYFNVSSIVEDINGIVQSYSEGIIIYSYNNKDWFFLSDTGSGKIENYTNLENIYIRLYSGNARQYISNDYINLVDIQKYLVDIETIPILTSLEGYKFGGENLLRWTKTMPVGLDEWDIQTKALEEVFVVKEDSDFSSANIYIPRKSTQQVGVYNEFFSPKIQIQPDYINETFTLSGFIFFGGERENIIGEDNFIGEKNYPIFHGNLDNIFDKAKNQAFEIWLSGFTEYTEKNTQYSFSFKIGSISHSDLLNDIQLEERKTNTWLKFSKTFDFKMPNDVHYPQGGAEISLDECKYFTIDFCCFNTFQEDNEDIEQNSFVALKQLKLELGNVASAWSASSSDLVLSDISGANLISGNTLNFQVEEDTLLFNSLKPKTYYTCSWKNVNIDNDLIYFKIVNEVMQEEKIIQALVSDQKITFFIDYDTTCSIFFLYKYKDKENNWHDFSHLIFFNQLKLEEGKNKSSYILTDDQVNILLNENIPNFSINEDGLITVNLNENNNNKQLTFYDAQSFQKYREDLKQEVNIQNTNISNISENLVLVNNELSLLSNSIIIETDADKGGPYIQIQAKQTGSFYQKNYLKLTEERLSFFSYNPDLSADLEVAYLSNQKLFITQAEIQQELAFGKKENGQLIFSVEDFGIAVYWRN